jgi:hypothetical protein
MLCSRVVRALSATSCNRLHLLTHRLHFPRVTAITAVRKDMINSFGVIGRSRAWCAWRFTSIHCISASGVRNLFIRVESTPNPDSMKFVPESKEVLPEKFGNGIVCDPSCQWFWRTRVHVSFSCSIFPMPRKQGERSLRADCSNIRKLLEYFWVETSYR